MANYNQVSYGSQGSDVTELQKLLNQNGYKLDEDGIFGSKTQAAVKDYQQKNNLAVDGIVGTNTWGALTKASTPTASTTTAGSNGSAFQYSEYKPSDAVSQAQAMLNQQLAQKPGEYQSQWQDQINDIIDRIMNREDFSYDLNSDAMYQNLRNQYMMQGQQAMMDTMGQAAALTGGYGNSFAQTAGQQAYQGHLQNLNDEIPDLYQMALEKYLMEGQNMYDQYSLLAGQEEQDYGRYQDQLGNWQTETDRLQGLYDTERNFDYGQWADGRDFAYGQYSDDRAYAYQEERDKVADEQWQKEYDEAIRQWNHKNGVSTSTGGTTGGTTNTTTNTNTQNQTQKNDTKGYDNGNLSDAGIRALQKALGVTVDGKWGPASQAAAKAKWGVTSANDAYQKYTGGQDKDGDGYKDGFTGSTYSEAVAYMEKNGVSSANASGVMTQSEWNRRKSSYQAYGTGGAEVKNYSTYKEYLADYVEYQMSKK